MIGSGQTGCQISEELHEAGREVFLACGRAPWVPRQPGGRDIVSWLRETTFFDMSVDALPSPAARLGANLQVTGARGGHDLHYRTLQTMGVQLLGRLTGVEGHRAHFADDLADSVAFGDARYADIRAMLSNQLAAKGMAVPELPDPPPFCADPPRELDLDGFGVVIYTTGFRPDYARWVRFPASRCHGLPAHPRWREHGRPRPLLLRGPLPAQAQVVDAVRRGRGRRHRGAVDRPQPIGAGRNRLKGRSLVRAAPATAEATDLLDGTGRSTVAEASCDARRNEEVGAGASKVLA